MLTKIDHLDLTNLSASLTEHQDRLAYFVNLADSALPIETFVHIADDFTVDRVAFCVLDADIVSVVLAVDCLREDLRSLTQYYTRATALRVYVDENYDFPTGDDWTVESLNLTLAEPKEKDVAEYQVQREDTHITLLQGDKVYVGLQTTIGDEEILQVMCLGEYDTAADDVVDLAMDYCAKNNLKLLLSCNNATWSDPMRAIGFGNERWGLRCEVAVL